MGEEQLNKHFRLKCALGIIMGLSEEISALDNESFDYENKKSDFIDKHYEAVKAVISNEYPF